MRQADLLEPVDLPSRLDQLDLYLGQVCTVAGISKMQLDYWTTKGGIETNGREQRTYDMRSVELVMRIKLAEEAPPVHGVVLTDEEADCAGKHDGHHDKD